MDFNSIHFLLKLGLQEVSHCLLLFTSYWILFPPISFLSFLLLKKNIYFKSKCCMIFRFITLYKLFLLFSKLFFIFQTREKKINKKESQKMANCTTFTFTYSKAWKTARALYSLLLLLLQPFLFTEKTHTHRVFYDGLLTNNIYSLVILPWLAYDIYAFIYKILKRLRAKLIARPKLLQLCLMFKLINYWLGFNQHNDNNLLISNLREIACAKHILLIYVNMIDWMETVHEQTFSLFLLFKN